MSMRRQLREAIGIGRQAAQRLGDWVVRDIHAEQLFFPLQVLLLVLGLWLRIEAVEHGWATEWEQRPSRLLLAFGLLTPFPMLLGFADR